MKLANTYLIEVVTYFNPLLTRYARRIIHNETLASHLVKRVLEYQYEVDKLVPSAGLRKILKEKTYASSYRIKSCLDNLKNKE